MVLDLPSAIRYRFDQRNLLPNLCGCYVVTRGEELLYIGVATNFASRWKGHHKEGELLSLGAEYIYLFVMSRELAEIVEARWIKEYTPLCNGGMSQEYRDLTQPEEPEVPIALEEPKATESERHRASLEADSPLLERLHPSLRASFVPLPPLGVKLTDEQMLELMGGESNRANAIQALREIVRLAIEKQNES